MSGLSPVGPVTLARLDHLAAMLADAMAAVATAETVFDEQAAAVEFGFTRGGPSAPLMAALDQASADLGAAEVRARRIAVLTGRLVARVSRAVASATPLAGSPR